MTWISLIGLFYIVGNFPEEIVGYWQRTDLPHYSGLIKVSFKEQTTFVDLISPGQDVKQPLRVTSLLKIVAGQNR